MNTYDELLSQLKDVRVHQKTSKDLMNKMIDSVKESEEYKSFQTMNQTENELIEQLEKDICELALAEYAQSSNKKPHAKVTIKTFKTFKIVEPETVRKWVLTNLPTALKVDEAMVKKYALEFNAVDGTETGQEERVQIASEL